MLHLSRLFRLRARSLGQKSRLEPRSSCRTGPSMNRSVRTNKCSFPRSCEYVFFHVLSKFWTKIQESFLSNVVFVVRNFYKALFGLGMEFSSTSTYVARDPKQAQVLTRGHRQKDPNRKQCFAISGHRQ